jgi:hypothetical protein
MIPQKTLCTVTYKNQLEQDYITVKLQQYTGMRRA